MVSALGRLGVLATPNDLLYVVGGYTHARVDALTSNVGLHGGTIGLGGEHRIDSLWTIRGEYRYTRFGSRTLHTNSTSSSVDISGTTTDTFTSMSDSTQRLSADLHSLRVGIARQFSP
jgi:opacity protein-like surface antigen